MLKRNLTRVLKKLSKLPCYGQRYLPEVTASLIWRKTLVVPTWGTVSPVAGHFEFIQQTKI